MEKTEEEPKLTQEEASLLADLARRVGGILSGTTLTGKQLHEAVDLGITKVRHEAREVIARCST